MSEPILDALNGISELYLGECESAWNAKALPTPPKRRGSGVFASLGYVAMVAAALLLLIVAPSFLRMKPTGPSIGIDEGQFDFTGIPEDIKTAFLEAYASIVQLDRETREELEEAHLNQYGYELSLEFSHSDPGERLGTTCYGVFEDCIVIFYPTQLTVITEKNIAGSRFSHGSSFVLLGYHDGVFYPLEEAYEKGFITKEEVAAAAECERKIGRYNGLLATLHKAELSLQLPEEATKEKIEDAFRQKGISLPWMDLRDESNFTTEHLRSYGDLDGCTVLVQVDPQGEGRTISIADRYYHSRSELTLWGYYKGVLYPLEEAYEKGYISQFNVGVASCRHSDVENYVDTVTEDDTGFSLAYPSEEWKAKFRREYIAYKGYDPINPETRAAVHLYGSYGDIHFVMVNEQNDCDADWTDCVADYVFQYSKYYRGNEILVWVNGAFLSMKDAYEQDLITKDLVYRVAKMLRYSNYELIPNVWGESKVDSETEEQGNFADNRVLVVMTRSASGINKEAPDFAAFLSFEIRSVKDLTKIDTSKGNVPLLNYDTFQQIFLIELAEHSKSNVLRAIEELKEMEGVQSADPDHIVSLS